MDDEARTTASISPIFPSIFLNLAVCKFLMPISPNEMYVSSISTFINLVILKWQGTEGSPFDTHPKTMTAAILCFLLMVCSIGAEEGFGSVRVWMSRFVSWFWRLSLASVVSLLLPDLIRALLYGLCFVPLLQHSYCGRVFRWFISMVDRRTTSTRLPV